MTWEGPTSLSGPPPGGRPEPLSRHLWRELGDAALAVDAHPGPDPDGRRPHTGYREGHQTRARLEATAWEIALREIKGERFVVLPAGALDDPLWRVGAWPSVKLSNE